MNPLQAAPGFLTNSTGSPSFYPQAQPSLFPPLLVLTIGTTLLILLIAVVIYAAFSEDHSIRDGQIVRVKGMTFRVKLVRVKLKWEEVKED
jgi:hypothetical protein